MRLAVPDDLSVVGFDDTFEASIVTPGLTTVRQPLAEMGRMAVALLTRLLGNQSIEALHVELQTTLVQRESTAPPPGVRPYGEARPGCADVVRPPEPASDRAGIDATADNHGVQTPIADRTLGSFLFSLASREPTPGGGASAALNVAQSPALVAMVARDRVRGGDGAAIALAARIAGEADLLVARSAQLIGEDMDAFAAVARAYGQARGDDHEKAARRGAIADASIAAATPPAAVVETVSRILHLAGQLEPIANRNVITDIAAAADAARAAASTARLNIEINLSAIRDARVSARFQATLDRVAGILATADPLSLPVRRGLSPAGP